MLFCSRLKYKVIKIPIKRSFMKKKILITVFSFSVLILLLSNVEKKTLIKIFNYLPEIVTSTTKFVIKNDYYLNKINNQ